MAGKRKYRQDAWDRFNIERAHQLFDLVKYNIPGIATDPSLKPSDKALLIALTSGLRPKEIDRAILSRDGSLPHGREYSSTVAYSQSTIAARMNASPSTVYRSLLRVTGEGRDYVRILTSPGRKTYEYFVCAFGNYYYGADWNLVVGADVDMGLNQFASQESRRNRVWAEDARAHLESDPKRKNMRGKLKRRHFTK